MRIDRFHMERTQCLYENEVRYNLSESKAFGLPGLRIGWIVGPPKTVAGLWAYQDYTTLTPSMLSDRLARAALEPRRREQILTRTRGIIRRHLAPVQAWIHRHDDVFDAIAPVAGAIVLVKYRLPIGSVALFDRLRLEKSVLVTPGAHFGIGKYLRIGYGSDLEKTLLGLSEVSDFLGGVLAGMRGPARAAGGRQTRA